MQSGLVNHMKDNLKQLKIFDDCETGEWQEKWMVEELKKNYLSFGGREEELSQKLRSKKP